MVAPRKSWYLVFLALLEIHRLQVLDGFAAAMPNSAEVKLRQHLFTGYDKSVRPVDRPEKFVNVSFSFQLSKIVELDNKNQLLTTDAWVTQEWVNPFLRWNESEFGGIHTIHILPADVWVPDIVLYNNGDQDITLSGFHEKFKTFVIVESDGRNNWMSPATFKSSCTLDIRFFPFDTQTCTLTFGSWTYDNRMLKLWSLRGDHRFADKFTSSGEWGIDEVEIKRFDQKYACCKHPFSDVSYSFVMTRKPLYYTIYLIMPCLIIALLTLLNFLIPVESGERIGFCITILLAMSVYLLLIADSLPKTSTSVPLIGLYYVITMAVIAMALAATTVTLRCHYSNTQPPTWLLRLTRREKGANKVVQLRGNEEQGPVPEKSDRKTQQGEQWKAISLALDKFFFAIFFVLTLIVSLATLVFSRM